MCTLCCLSLKSHLAHLKEYVVSVKCFILGNHDQAWVKISLLVVVAIVANVFFVFFVFFVVPQEINVSSAITVTFDSPRGIKESTRDVFE